ncbi:MAG: methyltransferase domain-containing protein [Promethearchaeota archaeon]
MAGYFAFASGENIELAKAELDSLIRILDENAVVSWTGPLALIEMDSNPTTFLLDRAAMIKEAGIILARDPSSDKTLDWVNDDIFRDLIGPQSSFSVRSKSLTGSREIEFRDELTILLGTRIRRATGARVALDAPDVRIVVILTSSGTIVCESRESVIRRELRLRDPGRKAFFHPSMMNSQLARAMCNLAGVRSDSIVLDPFCGGGGILCEIALLGARAIGIDLNWRLINGARTNLSAIPHSDFALIQTDASSSPVGKQRLDCIVTDPPYGRTSSTRGARAVNLVRMFLEEVPDMIRTGGRMCICGSSDMNVNEMILELGFAVTSRLEVRVHSGLTREVSAVQF